jgi:hypothetical protein
MRGQQDLSASRLDRTVNGYMHDGRHRDARYGVKRCGELQGHKKGSGRDRRD